MRRMAWTECYSYEEFVNDDWGSENWTPPWLKPGYQWRTRFVVRYDRRKLRKMNRGRPKAQHVCGYSPDGSKKAKQIGPVPCPWAGRRRRR